MKIVKYSHVQHIVSIVTGQLRTTRRSTTPSIYFPAGSFGAPKVRAVQLVAGLRPRNATYTRVPSVTFRSAV